MPMLVNALRLLPSLAFRALMPFGKWLITSRMLERALLDHAETLAKRTDSQWDDQAVELVRAFMESRR